MERKSISILCENIVNHKLFNAFIIFLILINAVVVGIETYGHLYERYEHWFYLSDRIILWLFTIEIMLKLIAAKPTFQFFKDRWNVFDFIIVASGHIFVGSRFLTVVRILRVLRIFRTISIVPSLRKLVNALLLTLPSLGTILMLMVLIFYVFSVIGTMLFKAIAPEYFGTLQQSALTLFQMVTLESWASGVMRPVMEHAPWAWVYFVTFILIGTFVILNLFVGVIVNNFERVEAEEKAEQADPEQEMLKEEIQLLRQEMKELKDIIQQSNTNK
ncbi:ion transporter [Salirhabdus salicampi]|uniref:ion transporter n=1 Tax=Salirhabdus salicampi TaxID=476102 RepID=UPI0020C44B8D|nr:ion transporter [Salirhabdus salicampi]MCP8617306.1 ion transporter [Salirhabdus salicampi]